MPTITELEKEVAELSEKLRVTNTLLEALRAYDERVGRKLKGGPGVTMRQRSGRASPVMNETERVAIDLMEREKGPVPTVMIVNEMWARGMAVPNKNPINVISARLSNNPRFKGRRGVGYWYSDRPWPGEEFQTPLGLNEDDPSAHTNDQQEAN